jgi:hypothetical protein
MQLRSKLSRRRIARSKPLATQLKLPIVQGRTRKQPASGQRLVSREASGVEAIFIKRRLQHRAEGIVI